MSTAYVGIDPGSSSGAICEITIGGKLSIANMPSDPNGIWHYLKLFGTATEALDYQVALENVGGTMPGNAAKAARTFATHMGHIEMALIAAKVPFTWVVPRKWMAWLETKSGVDFPKGMENKKDRKDAIHQAVQKLTGETITKRAADAVGIALYLKAINEV